MPLIESGNTAFEKSDVANSADVPQLTKPIACSQQPQCDNFRQGNGCEHGMSRSEMEQWLERLRSHRISIETGAKVRVPKAKAPSPKIDEREEF